MDPIQELRLENEQLRMELDAERFMVDEIAKMNTTQHLDTGIDETLKDLGEYTRADRVYLFETDENYVSTNTKEWCAEGVTPQIQNLMGIRYEEMPNWGRLFLDGKNILIEDIEDVKETMPQEYELLKVQDIRTLIVFPILLNGHLYGFIGVDNPDMNKSKLIERMLYQMGQYVGYRLEEENEKRRQHQKVANDLRKKYQKDTENALWGARIGMWSAEIDPGKEPRMQGDRTMNYLLGVDRKTADEDRYKVWYTRIEPSYVSEVDAIVDQILTQGFGEVIYPWNHPFLGKIWIRCGGILDQDYEAGSRILGYHQDVTRNEEMEQKYRDLIVATSQVYQSLHRINLENDLIERLSSVGYSYKKANKKESASEWLDVFCRKQVGSEYREQMREFLDLSTVQARLNISQHITQEYQNPDGIWLRAIFLVRKTKEDSIKNIFFMTQKINEVKRKELEYQKKLEHAVKDANRANEAKSDFLGRVSHDIRTPINGILGMLDIEEKSLQDQEKMKACHDKIRYAASQLLDLVNNILDMSKIESGTIVVEKIPFDIREVIGSCWALLEPMAARMNLTMEMDPDCFKHPYLIGSRVHINQIFMNILSNAVKYNKLDGSIRISARTLEETPENITYQFEVSDTGIGMSKEFQKHIFESFTQENFGARTVYSGSGLGMSIVARVIEALQGDIQVESEKGMGTTFRFTLTFQIDWKREKEEHGCCRAEDMRGMKVLVVEDNELNQEIAKYLLEEMRATVTLADDGQQALDIFQKSEPYTYDLILMDLMMPVMDGIQATEAIRNCGRADAKSIPIVAMTANLYSNDIWKAGQVGMTDYMTKPLNKGRLMKVVAEVCGRRNSL